MPYKTMVKKIFFLTFLGMVTILSACGRKGEPLPPVGQVDEFPASYPKDYD